MPADVALQLISAAGGRAAIKQQVLPNPRESRVILYGNTEAELSVASFSYGKRALDEVLVFGVSVCEGPSKCVLVWLAGWFSGSLFGCFSVD